MSRLTEEELSKMARGKLINLCLNEKLLDSHENAYTYTTSDLIRLLLGDSAGQIERIQE